MDTQLPAPVQRSEEEAETLRWLRDVLDNRRDKLTISWGVRCYYGAYDSKTTRVHEFRREVLAKLKILRPRISVTYFPAGGFYVGFDGLNILTPDLSSYESALIAVIKYTLKEFGELP